MDHLTTTSGSVYTLQQQFQSRDVLLDGKSLRIHHMAKHIHPAIDGDVPVKNPWNKKVSMSIVDTKTYIPYTGQAQSTSTSDTFILHNFGDYLFLPITTTKWVQQSHTEFVVAHENGAIYVYDHTFPDESSEFMDVEQPEGEFTLLLQREDRTNPVACWHVSMQAIYDVSFSPNGKYLACVGKTGALIVFQYHMQRKIAMMQSHFGALTCLAWSPNSLYILDDAKLYDVAPVLCAKVAPHPLTHIVFHATSIAVTGRDGSLLMYSRPASDVLPATDLAQIVPSYAF
ncbi:hypothetical protein B5M09_005438 [Aphanomyces astaci]|uniref:Uncharacterized protein n=1 Tax=Aphanomyces astaci TaxID=112090 RepID=A0A425DAU2_APHAT|nr:hypothetical protein B5M09_005438 [Aphanomyces astaci]